MAGVTVRIFFEISLMLGLGFPELAGRGHFGGRLAGPDAGGVDIGDGVAGDALLLGAGVKNRRAVAQAGALARAVAGRRIVDLKEEFEQLPIADQTRIENNLDRLGMGAVVFVGGI